MIQWSIQCSCVNMMKLSVTSWKLPKTMKDDGWLSRMKSDPINYSTVVWRNICCYSSPDCHIHEESHALANIGCHEHLRVSVSYFLLISVHISYIWWRFLPKYLQKLHSQTERLLNETYKNISSHQDKNMSNWNILVPSVTRDPRNTGFPKPSWVPSLFFAGSKFES